jgi:putative PIN family toxin of toxin-antitoxin system
MKNSLFVIDTNTLVSAFLSKYSKPTLAYEKARRTGKVLASLETYEEFCDVFVREKFDKYISLNIRLEILNEFKEIAIFIKISEMITDCRDPRDNKFLELAISANASCIITGDKDLLVLHPFRGIPILNAVDFLNTF